MGAIETLSTGSGSKREAVYDSVGGIHLAVLSRLGVDLPETAKITRFRLWCRRHCESSAGSPVPQRLWL